MKVAVALLMSLPAISMAQQVAFQLYAVDSFQNGFYPSITVGSDSALWFTDSDDCQIKRITTAGKITSYPVPYTDSVWNVYLWGVAAAPDGAIWFTELNGGKIGRLTPDGTISVYPASGYVQEPTSITLGPDGAMWFTEENSPKIGRIGPGGGITEYAVPGAATGGFGITAGPDGALWFTEFTGAIGRITTSGDVTLYPVPGVTDFLMSITAGPDGALWFVESSNNAIGRITTAGVVTQYPLPSAPGDEYGEPESITAGPDGALWFTQINWGNIARITTSGEFSWYPPPANRSSAPYSITTGPDGELWMGANAGGQIWEAVFTTATVTASPGSGNYGSKVTFSGSGFGPSEVVDIYAAGVGSTVLASAATDATGVFTAAGAVPQSVYGSRVFLGVGQTSGKIGAANYAIQPRLMLNPKSGDAGSIVAVDGLGFGPLETVNIYGGSSATLLGSITSDVHGTFAGSTGFSFMVPDGTSPGSYTVSATGATSGAHTSQDFAVE